MRCILVVVSLAALLMLDGAATARPRYGHHRGSVPIIAGQPNIRVTPSGNVVARHHRIGKRFRNGLVPLRRRHMHSDIR